MVSLSNTKERKPMAKPLLSALLTVAIAISASVADAQTAPTKPAATAPATKGLKRYPFHANVASVDAAAKTITLDGKKSHRVLHITPNTRVMKDKKPVALETIAVGEYITGSLIDTDGYLEPTTVNVGGTQKVAKATPPAQAPSTAAPNGSLKTAKPGQQTTRHQ
jgi:membrane-bound lytic murein transglycosylase B